MKSSFESVNGTKGGQKRTNQSLVTSSATNVLNGADGKGRRAGASGETAFPRGHQATRGTRVLPGDLNGAVEMRLYQEEIFMDQSTGIVVLHWARQIGKSYVLAAWCVVRLLTRPGRLVTVLSNSGERGGVRPEVRGDLSADGDEVSNGGPISGIGFSGHAV
jgi:hypothetical protein